jgi:anaerobic sulfite reductase subunit C
MDVNVKKLKKNAFRYSKVRGETAVRVRVPGGRCLSETLGAVKDIADKYGNGVVHMTTRQGFEIMGIKLQDMENVNRMLEPIIVGQKINEQHPEAGYTSSGTRNVCACIGNEQCPFGNYNTAAFALRTEQAIFPNDIHFKVAFTGCPNDCIKARMHDFGIIGMTEPQYDPTLCVGCEACVKGCKNLSVGALSMENYKVVRNADKCVGCGVCVTKCPMRAWTRSKERYYKLVIMGRTGKKESPPGRGLAHLGRRGEHPEDHRQHLRVLRQVHKPRRPRPQGAHRLHHRPRGLRGIQALRPEGRGAGPQVPGERERVLERRALQARSLQLPLRLAKP